MTERMLNMHAQMASDLKQNYYKDAPLNWVLTTDLLPKETEGWVDVEPLPQMAPSQVHATMKDNTNWALAIEWPNERCSHHSYNMENRRIYNWIPCLHASLLRAYHGGLPEQLNMWSPLEPIRVEKSRREFREAERALSKSSESEARESYEEGVVPIMGLHQQRDP
mgnify:CR=1 FL=1